MSYTGSLRLVGCAKFALVSSHANSDQTASGPVRACWIRGQAQGWTYLHTAHIVPDDFFKVAPGHDAYVDGSERVELVLFAPPKHQH